MINHMISKYFSWAEVLRSSTADRLRIKNIPNEKQKQALMALFNKLADPIRELFNVPLTPSSAFRSPELNAATPGSSSTSQHPKGEAWDFKVPGMKPIDVIRKIVASGIEFDQLIDEYGSWVHASYKANGKNRRQVLEYREVNGKTVCRALRL